jgi:hypothetical protein
MNEMATIAPTNKKQSVAKLASIRFCMSFPPVEPDAFCKRAPNINPPIERHVIEPHRVNAVTFVNVAGNIIKNEVPIAIALIQRKLRATDGFGDSAGD